MVFFWIIRIQLIGMLYFILLPRFIYLLTDWFISVFSLGVYFLRTVHLHNLKKKILKKNTHFRKPMEHNLKVCTLRVGEMAWQLEHLLLKTQVPFLTATWWLTTTQFQGTRIPLSDLHRHQACSHICRQNKQINLLKDSYSKMKAIYLPLLSQILESLLCIIRYSKCYSNVFSQPFIYF